MIISTSKKFIFVHVPRTGGISMSDALKPFADKKHPLKKCNIHAGAPELKSKFAQWDDYTTFGFVRNPWERLFSLYTFFRSMSKAIAAAKHLDFNNFLVWWLSGPPYPPYTKESISKLDVRNNPDIKVHRWSAIDLLFDKDGNKLVNYIGRYEAIDESFEYIMQVIGITVPLKRLHASKHSHYSLYYNHYSRDLVADVFADEIEMFGYEFKEITTEHFVIPITPKRMK